MDQFFEDTLRGLSASPKYLKSKYFYDEAGDALFKEIMECPEYYLTNCEQDIFTNQSGSLADTILSHLSGFDIAELGAGDASKTIYLLDALMKRNAGFTYYPIDISTNIINLLHAQLPIQLPGIVVHGLNGDYFAMLEQLKDISTRNKVVLFLGSSIGNIPLEETTGFFSALKEHLIPGDLVLTGFDLKKDPKVVAAAYNDKGGITARFNLNLLKRINNTYSADFDLGKFKHSPVYDEQTGACKSYLQSLEDQQVHIGETGIIGFEKGEQVFMEISQKYTVQQTDDIAKAAGFTVLQHFYDSKRWFLDALWQCNS